MGPSRPRDVSIPRLPLHSLRLTHNPQHRRPQSLHNLARHLGERLDTFSPAKRKRVPSFPERIYRPLPRNRKPHISYGSHSHRPALTPLPPPKSGQPGASQHCRNTRKQQQREVLQSSPLHQHGSGKRAIRRSSRPLAKMVFPFAICLQRRKHTHHQRNDGALSPHSSQHTRFLPRGGKDG